MNFKFQNLISFKKFLNKHKNASNYAFCYEKDGEEKMIIYEKIYNAWVLHVLFNGYILETTMFDSTDESNVGLESALKNIDGEGDESLKSEWIDNGPINFNVYKLTEEE